MRTNPAPTASAKISPVRAKAGSPLAMSHPASASTAAVSSSGDARKDCASRSPIRAPCAPVRNNPHASRTSAKPRKTFRPFCCSKVLKRSSPGVIQRPHSATSANSSPPAPSGHSHAAPPA